MKIEKLEIGNFRGFRGQHLLENLSPHMNVLVGINGSGKSSLLDLIAVFLHEFVRFLTEKDYQAPEFTPLDINVHEKESINQIVLIENAERICAYLEEGYSFKRFVPPADYIKDLQQKLESNPKNSIPIFKYFSAQRLTNQMFYFSGKKEFGIEQLKAFNGAFDKNWQFSDFVQWFMEEENIENREKIARKDFDYQNPYLAVIRIAIGAFFKAFKTDTYTNFRVENRLSQGLQYEKNALAIDKNGTTYNLKQLSDGEKNIILMVSDIAYRLSLANPELGNALLGAGIVLIDEIELHLHPAWQRAILPCLMTTFPNIQFFITTHSPQVVSSIDKNCIFKIDDFQILPLSVGTQGRDANSILFDVFDVPERDELYQKEIKLLYDYIENNDKDNAKTQLDKLQKWFGENDREIVRAVMYYDDLVD